jgi:hypothetical protein
MLARAGELPTGNGWAYEVKWDGFRAIVSTENGLRVGSGAVLDVALVRSRSIIAPTRTTGEGSMRRVLVIAVMAVVVGLSGLAGSASAANEHASCKGILVSSLAGEPGEVAEVTQFHP